MTKRPGTTLIEMLVVIAAISAILTLSAATLHRIMRSHNQAHTLHADEAAAWQLSGQLRRDLAKATEASIDQETTTIKLTIQSDGEQPVLYRFDPLQVTRQRDLGSGQQDREAYCFGGPTEWVVQSFPSPRRIEVSTKTLPTARTRAATPFELRVVARIASPPQASGATP